MEIYVFQYKICVNMIIKEYTKKQTKNSPNPRISGQEFFVYKKTIVLFTVVPHMILFITSIYNFVQFSNSLTCH